MQGLSRRVGNGMYYYYCIRESDYNQDLSKVTLQSNIRVLLHFFSWQVCLQVFVVVRGSVREYCFDCILNERNQSGRAITVLIIIRLFVLKAKKHLRSK